jgi:multidrug efflux system outer membrane protein
MNRRHMFVLVLLASCVACVKAPPQLAPDIGIAIPQNWTAADTDAAAPQGNWWLTLGDPQLATLIELSLHENRDLHVAAARLEKAEAAARIAGADLKPTVSAGLDASRSRQVITSIQIPGSGGGPLVSQSNRFGATATISWEADLWGRVRAGARAAVADYEAAEAELTAARLSIAARTAKLWYAILEGQQQVDLARNSTESYRRLFNWVDSRYRLGLLPALELRLADSNLASTEALLEQRLRNLDLAIRQLELVVGRYPDGSLLTDFAGGPLPAPPPPVPVGLPAELVTRRPDLIAAERRLAATDQRLLVARRALYPSLTLTGSGGSASSEFGDLLKSNFSVWNVVTQLTQPLFMGGKLKAGVALADAATDEALALYSGAILQAFNEVESLLAAEMTLARKAEYLSRAAEQLIAAEALAESRYRSGIGDYLTVLNSQTRAFVSSANLLALQRQRLENRINIHLAIGGGFEDGMVENRLATSPPVPPEVKDPS